MNFKLIIFILVLVIIALFFLINAVSTYWEEILFIFGIVVGLTMLVGIIAGAIWATIVFVQYLQHIYNDARNNKGTFLYSILRFKSFSDLLSYQVRSDFWDQLTWFWYPNFSPNPFIRILGIVAYIFLFIPFYISLKCSLLITTLFYILILGLFLIITNLVFRLWFIVFACEIRFLDWLISKVYGLFNKCQSCHQRIDKPIYQCPKCRIRYPELIPSWQFGLFFWKCKCGEILPTSSLLGRNKLPAFCPNPKCGKPILSSYATPISIVVLGAQKVGKTHFIMDSIYLLKEKLFPNMYQSYNIPNDRRIGEMLDLFEKGKSPDATSDLGAAICLEAKPNFCSFPDRIYIYDPPGEAFAKSEEVSRLNCFAYSNAAILIIDPFTLECIQAAYSDYGIAPKVITNPDSGPSNAFVRWLNIMERDFESINKKCICAVVINKTDEPSFAKIAGLNSNSTHDSCRLFLEKTNPNLIQMLTKSFKKVEYFAVSSVGAGGNGQAYDPQGIERVLKWILNNV